MAKDQKTKEKKKRVSKLKSWFTERESLRETINQQNRLLETQLPIATKRLEKLDQNGVYVIVHEGSTAEEIEDLNSLLHMATDTMRWTPPDIIILNTPLQKLDVKQLEKLLKLAKKRERGGGKA